MWKGVATSCFSLQRKKKNVEIKIVKNDYGIVLSNCNYAIATD